MLDPDRLERLYENVRAALPRLDAEEARLSIEIYRRLAGGQPIRAETLAEATGLPRERVESALEGWPGVFRDGEGSIVGYWGLAIPEMPHRFEVDGVRLHTWCAWDALFIPEILGKVARYSGRCPESGQPIRLEVGPRGVSGVSPAGVVLSFLEPSGPLAEDWITRFCHHIHFFASGEAAESWVGTRPGHLVLTLEEAIELGRRKNRDQYGGRISWRERWTA